MIMLAVGLYGQYVDDSRNYARLPITVAWLAPVSPGVVGGILAGTYEAITRFAAPIPRCPAVLLFGLGVAGIIVVMTSALSRN